MLKTKTILSQIDDDWFDTDKEEIKKIFRTVSSGKREKPRIYLLIQTNLRDMFVKYSPMEDDDVFLYEYNALQKVQKIKGFGVPRPIKIFKKGVVLSKVRGKPLELLIKNHDLNARNLNILRDVINSILAFHISGVQRVQDIPTDFYKETTGGKNASSKKELAIDKVHFGFTHGDLDPFNILIEKNVAESCFSLVDWEDFQNIGVQELDVLHFVVLAGMIANSSRGISNKKLYHIIFDHYEKNPYLDLLRLYCQNRQIVLANILQIIPVYCDTQNYRLIRAKRDNSKFLYSDFKKEYCELQ